MWEWNANWNEKSIFNKRQNNNNKKWKEEILTHNLNQVAKKGFFTFLFVFHLGWFWAFVIQHLYCVCCCFVYVAYRFSCCYFQLSGLFLIISSFFFYIDWMIGGNMWRANCLQCSISLLFMCCVERNCKINLFRIFIVIGKVTNGNSLVLCTMNSKRSQASSNRRCD